jgi:Flp pilus assembly protein TadD
MEDADYKQALNDLTTALYLNPQNGRIYDLLGSVYEKLGDSAAAAEHFFKAIYWNDRTNEAENN